MKLIVGLGNPGPTYAEHRHNVGFHCVDEFARRHHLVFSRRQGKSSVVSGQVSGVPVLLAKPETYMNRSGEAVATLVNFYKIAPADLIVIYDELDLPLGRIRIRSGGGSGGHNGMQSIVEQLGRQDFPRLRVGIGRPGEGVTDPEAIARYVLSPFSSEERVIMARTCARAAEAIHTIVVEGVERAMNQFNKDG